MRMLSVFLLGAALALSAQIPSKEDMKKQADATVDKGNAKAVAEKVAK